MEKQNGQWKITGSTNINTSGYSFTRSLAGLQSFIGKWKYVERSYKSESEQPSDSNFRQVSSDYDIRETPYGIEFSSVNVSSYLGKPSTSLATEDFIADKSQRIIKYFDFEKSANSNVTTATGTASFDTSGRFVVKGMYEDKPTLTRFENIYTFTPDGLLHQQGISYDTNGRITFKWFFAMKQM